MSPSNSDTAKTKQDELLYAAQRSSKPTRNGSPLCENEGASAVYTASPHGRLRNSTLASHYTDIRSSRLGSHPSSGTSTPASSQPPTPTAKPALEPADSSSSMNTASLSGHRTRSNGADRSSRTTPVNSVLELKRFFGKGRTKHEHGVRMAPREPKKKQRPVFSIFGLGKKKQHSGSSSNTPNQTAPPSPATSIFHLNLHGHGHHHHHISNLENSHAQKSPRYPQRPQTQSLPTPQNDLDHLVVKGKPPADLDPNFVVHGPDYEADWDPFHTFGLTSSSDHMPFLESGITKYGEVGRDMGSGAGGSVRMMERPSDNKLFAVKEFRARRPNETPQKYAKHMTAEYALGAALHHKNIIETIDLIKEGDRYFEVMEYGPHDFFELVMTGGMTTPQINSSFHQIVSGVAYLHSMGVAHRDLKLDNCVVTDEGVVKLIDFGSAIVFKYPMSPQIHLARGILGSDPYLAPEVFLKHPYQPQCADVWSCGIIYCCTYLRRFPWKLPQREDSSFRKFVDNPANTDGQHPIQDKAQKITGPWRLLRLLPKDSRDIIASVLKVDVRERATVNDIQRDPWFSTIKEISVLPAPMPEKETR